MKESYGSGEPSTEARPETVDLVIRHGHVLPMAPEPGEIVDGALAIDGGRIVSVGTDASLNLGYRGRTTIDAKGGLIHPGLIEGHVHASYHLVRGLIPEDHPADDVFDAFERPFYDAVTDEDEYLGVVLASLEMVRNGTTCFLEAGTVLTPSAAEQAAIDVGIRAVIGDGRIVDPSAATTDGAVGRLIKRSPKTLDDALAQLGVEAARPRDPESLVTGHVAIHGLGTASTRLIREAKRRADSAGTVLNMHFAYAPEDAAASARQFGLEPLVRMGEDGLLGSNVTFSHANFVTPAEVAALRVHQVSVAWAPAASMLWGIGGAIGGRHADLHRSGGHVCLASDSGNWSNDFDLFRQMDLALLISREVHADRTYLSTGDVLGMATRGGGRAIGQGGQLGILAPGYRADVVIHRVDRPEAHPPHDAMRTLALSARSKTVHTVIIAGEVVLLEGQFPRLDEGGLLRWADSAATGLVERMGLGIPTGARPHPRA